MPEGYLPQNTIEASTEVKETMRYQTTFQYTWDEGYRPNDFAHSPGAEVTYECERGTMFEVSAGSWSKTASLTCGAEVELYH